MHNAISVGYENMLRWKDPQIDLSGTGVGIAYGGKCRAQSRFQSSSCALHVEFHPRKAIQSEAVIEIGYETSRTCRIGTALVRIDPRIYMTRKTVEIPIIRITVGIAYQVTMYVAWSGDHDGALTGFSYPRS